MTQVDHRRGHRLVDRVQDRATGLRDMGQEEPAAATTEPDEAMDLAARLAAAAEDGRVELSVWVVVPGTSPPRRSEL